MTHAQSIRTFPTWLREQIDRNGRIGDLARDAVADEPEHLKSMLTLKRRVEDIGCEAAQETLIAAIQEWKQLRREWRDGAALRRELRN